MSIVEGGSARITVQYVDEVDDVLVDPVTATVKVRDPDGQLVVYSWTGSGEDTLTKTPNTTGIFYVDLAGLEAGVHYARAESTQPDTVAEHKFAVEASRVL